MEMKVLVVFCEDVRREFDGRFILIGVYPGVIFLDEESEDTKVSQYIQITGLKVGTYSFKLRAALETANGLETISRAKIDVSAGSDYPVILTPTGMVLGSDAEGTLKILVTLDDGPEFEAASIGVVKFDPADERDEEPEED